MAKTVRLPQRAAAPMGAADFDPTVTGMPAKLRAPDVDRDARSFLRLFNAVPMRPLAAYPLALMRQRWRFLALSLGRRDFSGDLREIKAETPEGRIRMRIYTPRGSAKTRPAFIWFHGGAFLIGEADTADSICRNIAAKADCAVVAVEYRLAPEHDLFAGRADCIAAVDWLFANGASIGIDPYNMAVGGDSAGGNLAAVIAQECHKRGRALKLQVLVYPATNLADPYPSRTENGSGYLLTAESIDWIQATIGDAHDTRDVRLSPFFEPDLRGLPDTILVSAGYDPIRDDGLHYAQRLRAAGVPVEILHYAGEFHGFVNFDAVLAAARDALTRIEHALRAAFANQPVIDRTVEIADPGSGRDARGPADAFSEWMTMNFMTGEWLEYHRNRMLKAFLPGLAQPVDNNGLFNLTSTFRRMVTAAPIEAQVTFESKKRQAKPGA